MGKKLLM